MPCLSHSVIVSFSEENLVSRLSAIAFISFTISTLILESRFSANTESNGLMSFSILSLVLLTISTSDCRESKWLRASTISIFAASDASMPSLRRVSIMSWTKSLLLSSSDSISDNIAEIIESLSTSSSKIYNGWQAE